jgi:L-iditol 2-dehydrogenase
VGEHVTVRPFVGCGDCDRCEIGRDELCPDSRMLGVHLDGAFAEELVVPARLAHALPPSVDPRSGAYTEPVAAVLAVRDALRAPPGRGVILGDNRIARLTERVLRAVGVDELVLLPLAELGRPARSSFDFAIESVPTGEALAAAARLVRPGGTVVLKSRSRRTVELPLGEAVNKQLTFRAVRYASFDEAITLLPRLALEDLFGPSYALEEFDSAFASAFADERDKRFFTFGSGDVWDR